MPGKIHWPLFTLGNGRTPMRPAAGNQMVITGYNDDWPNQFSRIKKILEDNLTGFMKIEHVGSTSIAGMCAKPVIDIDIVIDSILDFEKIRDELGQIHYRHQGDLGIPGREAFKRDGSVFHETLDSISHNLYVCAQDNAELKRHILFRDYLKKNEKRRNEYKKIKNDIIAKYGNEDRKKYVDVKETEYKWFFEEVIAEASATI